MSSTASLHERYKAAASNDLLLKGYHSRNRGPSIEESHQAYRGSCIFYKTEALFPSTHKPVQLVAVFLHHQKHTAHVRKHKATHPPPPACLSGENMFLPVLSPSWEEKTLASPMPTPGAAGPLAGFMCAEPHVILTSSGKHRAFVFNEVKSAQVRG